MTIDNNEATTWNALLGGGCGHEGDSWGKGFAAGVLGTAGSAVVAGTLSMAIGLCEIRAMEKERKKHLDK